MAASIGFVQYVSTRRVSEHIMENADGKKTLRICRKCGKPFERKLSARNARHCDDCSLNRYGHGPAAAAIWRAEPRLKAAANASGNPKIYRADEHSQKFLKSLIPGR